MVELPSVCLITDQFHGTNRSDGTVQLIDSYGLSYLSCLSYSFEKVLGIGSLWLLYMWNATRTYIRASARGAGECNSVACRSVGN
jgi:hypothetical protein